MASCILCNVDEAGVLFNLLRSYWSGRKSWTACPWDDDDGRWPLHPIIREQVLDISNEGGGVLSSCKSWRDISVTTLDDIVGEGKNTKGIIA